MAESCYYGMLRARKDSTRYTRAYLVGVYNEGSTKVGTVTFITHPKKHQENALMRHVFRTRLSKEVGVEVAGVGVAVRSEFSTLDSPCL